MSEHDISWLKENAKYPSLYRVSCLVYFLPSLYCTVNWRKIMPIGMNR